jgi:hypothetical protein
MKNYSPIIILIMLISCNSPKQDVALDVVNHPTPENTNYSNVAVFADEDFNKPYLYELSQKFENSKFVSNISENHVLGHIQDVELDEFDNVYLADTDQVRVFKINLATDKVDTLGKKGRGPGEILAPNAIQVWNNNIYIADDVSGIIAIDISDRNNFTHIFRELGIKDISLSNEGIFIKRPPRVAGVGNFQGTHSIEFISFDTHDIKKRFGGNYNHKHQLAVANYSEGKIKYIFDSNIIVTGNYFSPVITAYKNGEVWWQRRINNYKQYESKTTPTQITVHDKHLSHNRSDREPFHILATIEDIEKGIIIIQFETRIWPAINIHEEGKLITYLVDSKTGESIRIMDMPLIMATNELGYIAKEIDNGPSYNYYKF